MRQILLAASLALASPAAAETVDHRAILDNALDDVVLPAFAAFASKAETLATTVKATCDGGTIEALRDAYAETYAAWMALDAYRFGPVEERGAALSVNFWPDRKNFTGRALRGLAGAATEDLADPDFIDAQSAAAQGLPALERLIVNERHCPLAPAIAAHLSRTAAGLDADWRGSDGWASLMRAAGPDNPVYLDTAETSAALYKALDFGLQTLSEARLGRPLGTFDAPRPKRAEAWRSGLSRTNALAQFGALEQLYRIAFAPGLPNTAVKADWQAARIALDRIPEPLHEAVTDPNNRLKVEAAKNRIDALRKSLAETLAPKLGVAIGFNSADGD